MSRYDPLTSWLSAQPGPRIRCTFAQLNQLVSLPASAKAHDAWWYGTAAGSKHVQKRAWEAAGYTVESADRGQEVVIFTRL